MNDLQLLDLYCETCLGFIEPRTFKEIQHRGLYSCINNLPHNVKEAKVVARARYAEKGKYIGDPEIEEISQVVETIKRKLKDLVGIKPTDVDKMIPVLKAVLSECEFLSNYYKN